MVQWESEIMKKRENVCSDGYSYKKYTFKKKIDIYVVRLSVPGFCLIE